MTKRVLVYEHGGTRAHTCTCVHRICYFFRTNCILWSSASQLQYTASIVSTHPNCIITVVVVLDVRRVRTVSSCPAQADIYIHPRLSSSPHLPREAVALGVVEPKVSYLGVLDVHPSLAHSALGSSLTSLVLVGDDLRDGADIRPAIGFVFVDGVSVGIPRKHLTGGKGGGRPGVYSIPCMGVFL